jgi:hypothetical protein
MDPYTKTGLRLNRSTPIFPSGAARPAPTSAEEQALLFLIEPQPDRPADAPGLQKPPGAIPEEADAPEPPAD